MKSAYTARFGQGCGFSSIVDAFLILDFGPLGGSIEDIITEKGKSDRLCCGQQGQQLRKRIVVVPVVSVEREAATSPKKAERTKFVQVYLT